MENHASTAPLAAGGPAARLAGEHRRIAAPVDENKALLPVGKTLLDFEEKRFAKALLRRIRLDIQGSYCGQPRAGRGAAAKLEPLVASEGPVVPGLERWSRRAEHHRAAGDLGAVHRGVAGGVAQALLLLERGVVLLVDDDQGKPGQRRKHREPRAEHDARFAARGGEPGAGTRDVL